MVVLQDSNSRFAAVWVASGAILFLDTSRRCGVLSSRWNKKFDVMTIKLIIPIMEAQKYVRICVFFCLLCCVLLCICFFFFFSFFFCVSCVEFIYVLLVLVFHFKFFLFLRQFRFYLLNAFGASF